MTAAVDLTCPPTILAGPALEPAPVVPYVPRPLPELAPGEEVDLQVPPGWTQWQYVRALQLAEDEAAQMARERARRAAVVQIGGVFGSAALAAVLLVMAVRTFNGFATLALLGQATLWTAGGLVALTVGRSARDRIATIGGRKIEIRTGPHAHHTLGEHGTWTASEHEAGHVVVAKGVGCRVLSAHIFRDGSGVTYIRMRRDIDPVSSIAIDVAGHVGARTSAGCGSDFAYKDATLKELPWEERGKTTSQAYGLARSLVNSPFSNHPELSKKIFEKGSVYF